MIRAILILLKLNQTCRSRSDSKDSQRINLGRPESRLLEDPLDSRNTRGKPISLGNIHDLNSRQLSLTPKPGARKLKGLAHL